MTSPTDALVASIRREFGSLRLAGITPPFGADTAEEANAGALYAVLLGAAGVDAREVKRLVLAYIASPAHKPGFPVAWPSPGHLLQLRDATISEADAMRVFERLVSIAQGAGEHLQRCCLPYGAEGWSQVFEARVRVALGELSPAVVVALAAVGGRQALEARSRSDFDASQLRRDFLAALRTAEQRGRVGAMRVPQRLAAPELRAIDADADIIPEPGETARRFNELRLVRRGGR